MEYLWRTSASRTATHTVHELISTWACCVILEEFLDEFQSPERYKSSRTPVYLAVHYFHITFPKIYKTESHTTNNMAVWIHRVATQPDA